MHYPSVNAAFHFLTGTPCLADLHKTTSEAVKSAWPHNTPAVMATLGPL